MFFKIVNYFSKNIFITNVIIFLILALGIFISTIIKREIAPQVEASRVQVKIYYPSASAQEIEQDLIIPLEEAIQGFDISLDYDSFANDAYGQIIVLMPLNDEVKDNRQRLMQLLQNATTIPEGARVVITEEGPQSIPIYLFVLRFNEANNTNLQDLQQWATVIQKRLVKIPEVYSLETSGLLQKEISVNVDPQKLQQKYVSFYELITTINRRNIRSSAGLINEDSQEKIVITDAGFLYPLDITNAIIRSNFERKGVTVGEVAEVTFDYEKANNDVYIENTYGVSFGVRSKNDVDISFITKKVNEVLGQLEKELPKDMSIVIVERRADAVNAILDLTQSSIFMGILIVFAVLLLFLDFKTAFWTTMSIPMTIAAVIVSMQYFEISLNIISLCGIITVLGMLVDHGIVISESIYTYKSQGYSPAESVKRGIGAVFQPVTITIITTIAAFLPLVLIRDTIGNLIKPLPLVICIALVFSFLDSIIFLPAHLAHGAPKKVAQEKEWFLKLRSGYGALLKTALKWRYFVVAGFVFILFSTVTLMSYMMKGFVFIEPIGVSSLYINMEAPPKVDRVEMKKIVNRITEIVREVVPETEIATIKEEVGKYHVLEVYSQGYAANRGQVGVFLTPETTRDPDLILKEIQTAIESRPVFKDLQRVFYETYGLIPKSETALNIKFLKGINATTTNYILAMKEVFDYTKNIKGVINPEHSSLEGKKRMIISFDYEKMAQLGIDAQSVSDTVKIATSGAVASVWRTATEKIPYIISVGEKNSISINQLKELLIPNFANRLIPLKEFTEIMEEPGIEDIYRNSGQRMVELYVDVDPNLTTPTLVEKKALDYYYTISNKYPDVEVKIGGESAKISKAFEDFKIAFTIAIIFIYLILLFLFNKFIQPMIVLITIPFGIVGAIWAFFFHGQVLSFMSLVGIIGLSGVVVNDAVVMVDFINTVVRSERNEFMVDAIVQGAQNRLKAVVLTTLTTVLGLLPSIYGLQGVADLIIPIATAMAYGLLFATLLTLFLIPCLYLIGEDLSSIFPRIRKIVFKK